MDTNIKIIRSKFGTKLLSVDGFIFQCTYAGHSKKLWECQKRRRNGCKARLHTAAESAESPIIEILKLGESHNHERPIIKERGKRSIQRAARREKLIRLTNHDNKGDHPYSSSKNETEIKHENHASTSEPFSSAATATPQFLFNEVDLNLDIIKHEPVEEVAIEHDNEESEECRNIDQTSLCLICNQRENSVIAIARSAKPFPSSKTGNLSKSEEVLKPHIWSIFILRRLLHFSKEQCTQLLSVLGGSNPGDWFILCENCSTLTQNMYRLEWQVDRLEKKLTGLKRTFKTKLNQSVTEESVNGSTFENINKKVSRDVIRSYLKDNGCIAKPVIDKDNVTQRINQLSPAPSVCDNDGDDDFNEDRLYKPDGDLRLNSVEQDDGVDEETSGNARTLRMRKVSLSHVENKRNENLRRSIIKKYTGYKCSSKKTIQNNSSQDVDADIEVLRSKRGTKLLSVNGFIFHRSSTSNEKLVWECQKRRQNKCKARVHTTTDCESPKIKILKFGDSHNHARPITKPISKRSIQRRARVAKLLANQDAKFDNTSIPPSKNEAEIKYERDNSRQKMDTNIEILPSGKGSKRLVLDGFIFHCTNVGHSKKLVWECQRRRKDKCKARLHTTTESPTIEVLKHADSHNHDRPIIKERSNRNIQRAARRAELLLAAKEGREVIKRKRGTGNPRQSIIKTDTGYNCKLCPYTSPKFTTIIRHIYDHTLSKTKCNLCNWPIDTDLTMNIHMKKYHRSHFVPKIYKCDKCSFQAKQRQRLTEHNERYHKRLEYVDVDQQQGTYSCKLCPKVFDNERMILRHVGKYHFTEFGLSAHLCHICALSFRSARTLRGHLQFKHVLEKSFKCDTCFKCFYTQSILKTHQLTHLSEAERQALMCDECGSSFLTVSGLRRHMHALHLFGVPKSSMQEETEPVPNSSSSTRGSGRKKNGEIDRNKFRCKHCDQICLNGTVLTHHKKKFHPELFTFECDVCHNKFGTRKLLRRHMKIVHVQTQIHSFVIAENKNN